MDDIVNADDYDPAANLAAHWTAQEMDQAGLLHVHGPVRISPFAVFVPCDDTGTQRPVVLHTGATIGAFTVVHGGTVLGEQARLDEHVICGQPERGYAVQAVHSGAGAATTVSDGAVLRAGSHAYAGVTVGNSTVVGHHTLLRSHVAVGADGQLGHHLTVERCCRIGDRVRCSPGSHLTSATTLADGVFLGAGLRTINDKTLTWRDPHRAPELIPPVFARGAKVGTGTTVLAGITVGAEALVGASSLLTRDVPPAAVVYGQPARVHGQVSA